MKNYAIGAGVLLLLGHVYPALGQSLFERCEKHNQEISDMEQDLRNLDEEIKRLDARQEELEQQKRAIKKDKRRKLRDKASLIKQIKLEMDRKNRRCRPLRECESYERKIERLRNRMDPMWVTLRIIRKEIRSRKDESTRLNLEVEKIENSYQQLACEDLVPGQTSQSTIDRCTDLFSRWNELQNDINSLNDSVLSLRDRYQRQMRKMHTYENELASLLRRMRKACSHSRRLAELEDMEKEHKDYRSMKDDLDDMGKRVLRFKALKIRRPLMKIKPRKKDGTRPLIKPKKQKRSLRDVDDD